MSTFLEEVSQAILEKYATDLEQLTVVFPNRRAGLFFQHILAHQAKQSGWAPRIITFEDFVSELSGARTPDHLTLLFHLYQIFIRESNSQETFDHFYFWGDLLLQDFDAIDKALVKTSDLFANLKDLKELEANYDYLTDDQRSAITRFWKSFQHGQSTSSKENFLRFWVILHRVYTSFTQFLQQKEWAYEGLMLRQLADRIDSGTVNSAFPQLAFVGLHALAPAEDKLIKWFVKEQQADVFWDMDSYYVRHPQHQAGTYFRRYQRDSLWKKTFPNPLPNYFFTQPQRGVQAVGINLHVGQAKYAGAILREISQQPGFIPEKTAVVLPDENLLFPLLHSLPPEIRRVNVTMGYPVRSTALYSLIEHALSLQEDKRYNSTTEQYEFHHSQVLSLLRHPYLRQLAPNVSDDLGQDIEKRNQVYISEKHLQQHPLYTTVFQPLTQAEDTFDYLLQLLQRIYQGTDSYEESKDQLAVPLLEQELVYQLSIQVNRLKALAQEHQFTLTPQLLVRIFRQMMQGLRLPFTGEPLRGLQVMGVLETRNLDFDNVIILSFNEGVYPKSEMINTFIPGNLRRGFGLSTVDEQDAIYAYTFYRLLHRAKRVHLLYNTADSVGQQGEMSRFLYQLLYESDANAHSSVQFPNAQGDFTVSRKNLGNPVQTIPPQPIAIRKDTDVLQRLHRYTHQVNQPPRRSLTPSALNTYLDCRLKFYYKYVVDLKEPEIVQEEVDPAVFGNLLHRAMELVYQSVVTGQNRTVTVEIIEELKSQRLTEAVKLAFKEHYGQVEDTHFTLEGRNLIVYDIVLKMTRQILAMDTAYAPFDIVSLERDKGRGYFWETTIRDEEGTATTVSLRGIIDRIDQKGTTIRVLDYKTGRDEKQTKDLASLFNRDEKLRNKAAFQALFYALLYRQHSAEGQIVPGLINAKDLFNQDFDSRIYVGKEAVNDFEPWQEPFIQELHTLLLELFNPNAVFDQTDDLRKCSLCPYAKLCY
ncbi:PD-(D/E)XK nuclease family protein [Tunicatimonas pelagia]|uniref:PD-(D/E)XK nuclease family protein n=1 Tax=Tunicatimonas pelagia TaxID=931531 RepID=UPI002666A79A|nr:PD-(D/E)XK nuclease family protein [Tunicatimonas pelagia]WKN42542.1 PD-(D/E)XK nuclease family protein [Tunicatimonas pelagia]